MELWGEIPVETIPKTYLESIEQDSIKEFVPLALDNEAKFFEPECPEPIEPRRIYKYSLNPPILQHTIELLKYSKKLKNAVDQLEEYANKEDDECKEVPRIPDFPEFPQNYPFGNGSTKDLTSGHTCKDGITHEMKPVMLSHEAVRKILLKSIAAIFCHAGYDAAPKDMLNLLCDVVEDYFHGMMRLLRKNVDRQMISENLDIMSLEEAFQGMGFDGLKEYQNYFESMIQNHDRLLARCENLVEEFKEYNLTENE
ncbi:STAGA complex 65 subunit gamma-like [Stegodyphus dumicola]|uniref:STAGA complex 65 subunit gamma-like n=1 Tax=Stegodyphus dumicola TaxID=202533 RepID=UPI0015A7C4B7|nr:STAGA complex 65 subunit gamma-like [Stegodyphus dumicola]XP_035231066.1 STAGA complex 65 subunit gamma-like [Stegodyphus dumicola]XP_035231067.1 STAGA complex 65 subunit gamma-like [Stegodyphus dumicola]